MTDPPRPNDPEVDGDAVGELSAEPFFRDFRPSDMETLAPHARHLRLDGGTTVFRAGESADRFYLVRRGRVAIYLPSPRQDVIVQTVGPGDALGFSWLAPPHLWRFSAVAQTDVQFVEFDAAALRRAAIADRELHDLLLTRMFTMVTRRLEATRMQLLDIYGDPRTT